MTAFIPRALALAAFLTAGLLVGDAPAAGPAGYTVKMQTRTTAPTASKARVYTPKVKLGASRVIGGSSLGYSCGGNVCTCTGDADCEDMFDKDYLCIPGTEGVDETGTIRGWCRIR